MADGNEIALEFPLRALLTILGAIGERLPLLQIPSEQVETARRVLGSDILVMYPSGEIGDYILEAARERDINLLRWDPRAAKGEEIVASLGLKDMEIIIKPRGHEIEVFFGELVAQLEPKQGVYFIAEDNEIDPLWYVSSLDNHGFQQRDDLVVFAMNQVLFKDLVTYANHHDCGIPHPKFEILDTSDESKAAKELVQFMKRHGGGLVYPEITTFCHGVTEIPGQDVTRLDETRARRAIETALNLGSVQTSRGKVVLEAWIPDIVAELFLILCYDGQRFLRCPPIIYQKEFFAGSKARYMYTTVESRTGPGLRNWMPETLSACYNTSERLIKFIYEHMDSLQHVVKSRFTDPCPPLRRTYGFFALKWFITRGREAI